MRGARTVIAVLLAFSLAILPMAASMAAPLPAQAPAAPTETAAAAVDCEHHRHGHALPEQAPPAADHCAAMMNCGLCCVTLTGVGVGLVSHDIGMGVPLEPVRLSGLSLSWLTAPPLRPPRA